MSYIFISFLVGGVLTFIPSVKALLTTFQKVFYSGRLDYVEMFILWGTILAIIVLTVKSFVAEENYWKLWKFTLILVSFLAAFIFYVSSN